MFLCKRKLIGQKYKFENERKTQFFVVLFALTHTLTSIQENSRVLTIFHETNFRRIIN